MDNDELLQHIIAIKDSQARLETKVDDLHITVKGNGQPGLAQRVSELEGDQKWMWGAGSGVVFLIGLFEWAFHYLVGGKGGSH